MKSKTKTTVKTKAVAKKVVAKKAADDTTFRVHYLSKELRLAARAAREKAQITQADQLEFAVDSKLGLIVADLASVGIVQAKNVGPARLPLKEATLKQLREASNASGLPMSALLAACLTLASKPAKKGGK